MVSFEILDASKRMANPMSVEYARYAAPSPAGMMGSHPSLLQPAQWFTRISLRRLVSLRNPVTNPNLHENKATPASAFVSPSYPISRMDMDSDKQLRDACESATRPCARPTLASASYEPQHDIYHPLVPPAWQFIQLIAGSEGASRGAQASSGAVPIALLHASL